MHSIALSRKRAMDLVQPIILNKNLPVGAEFQQRFVLPVPQSTNAPRASTRISQPRPGVIARSDPFAAAKDRKGRAFA